MNKAKSKAKRTDADSTELIGSGAVRYALPKGGGGTLDIRIDFGQVPPPPTYAYADCIALHLDKSLLMSTLSFARRVTAGKATERVDIMMPQSALLHGFWESTRSVEEVVDSVLAQLDAEPHKATAPVEAEPVATLYANVIHIAVGSGETSLDFYCLSPRDVHLARTQRANLSLQPIVRIYISTVLTKSFFDLLRPHIRQASASKGIGGSVERATAVR